MDSIDEILRQLFIYEAKNVEKTAKSADAPEEDDEAAYNRLIGRLKAAGIYREET